MLNVIFDLDGTLVDTAPDLHRIANELLLARNHDRISLDQTKQLIGHGPKAFIDGLIKLRRMDDSYHEQVFQEFRVGYSTDFKLSHIYPGACEALDHLTSEGHDLGLCTNKPEKACVDLLRFVGLDDRFSVVVAASPALPPKPSPLPLLQAASAMSGQACVFVGDSKSDAEAASSAYIPFILFTEGYCNAAVPETLVVATFSDFHDLPSILSKLSHPAS